MYKHFYIIIASVVLWLTFSCKKNTPKEATNATEKATPSVLPIQADRLQLMGIELTPLEEKVVYPTVYANGVVSPKPNHEASLTPRLPGVIDKIWVLEGSNVKKGQIIMTLSSSEFVQLQQNYIEAVVQKNFLLKEYERQSTLKNANVGALSEFQMVESKYLSALANEKSLRAKIELQGLDPLLLQDPSSASIITELHLKSPIAGYIYNMPAKVGMRAEPGTLLAEIIDLSELRADLNVYEKDLNLISEKQQVEIQFINNTIPPVMGEIDYISRTINKETRSVVIHSSFKAPKGYLILPEMSITAKIKGFTSGKKAKVVPTASVFDNGDQQYLFYTQSGAVRDTVFFKKVKIQTSVTDGTFVEVIPEEHLPTHGVKVAKNNLSNLDVEYRKYTNKK